MFCNDFSDILVYFEILLPPQRAFIILKSKSEFRIDLLKIADFL